MSTFSDFRDNSAAADLVQSLVGLDITKILSWDHFTQAALQARPAKDGDYQPFIDRVDRRAGTASTGELALLMAVLFAMDYRWLAEKVASELGRSFMQLMEYTSGEHAQAAGACLERRDDGPSAFDAFERDCLKKSALKIRAFQNGLAVERTIDALGPEAFSLRGMHALIHFCGPDLKGEALGRFGGTESPSDKSVATE